MWLVSARKLPHDGCALAGDASGLRVFRYDGGPQWGHAQLGDLLAADPAVPTVLWVHGNRIDTLLAYYEAWAVYKALTRSADPQQPVRLVAFSWPTEQIKGPLKDVRLKAHRAAPAGYYLAQLLDRFDPQAEIGLIGFSFGARVITGALHLLAGDDASFPLEPQPAERRAMRVVLLAAAVDQHALAPGHGHGSALELTERVLLIQNSCDRALRLYHLLDPCTRAAALGYYGLPPYVAAGFDAAKIEQFDAAWQVGQEHSSWVYLRSPELMALAASALLPAEPTPPAPLQLAPAQASAE